MPGLVHRLMPRHPGSMPLPPGHGAQPGSGFKEEEGTGGADAALEEEGRGERGEREEEGWEEGRGGGEGGGATFTFYNSFDHPQMTKQHGRSPLDHSTCAEAR